MKKKTGLLILAMLTALASVCVQAFADSGGIELPIIPGGTTHRYGAWTVVTPATCTEEGEQYCVCSDCNRKKTETIPALGHNTVTDPAKEATCTATGLTEGSHCDRCGEVFVAQEEVPMTDHSFGDWETVSAPTFTQEGQQQRTCINCPETQTQPVAVLEGRVEKWNIALQDALQVNFHILLGENIADSAVVKLTLGDTAAEYAASDLELTEEGLYKVSVKLAAAQMTQSITVQIFCGEAGTEAVSYTARQYADTVLTDDAQTQYHDMVRAMLHYGAAAQTYFGYEASGAANAGIPAAEDAQIPEEAPQEMSVTGEASGAVFHAVSLVHREKLALRYYFRLENAPEDYRFSIGGVAYTPVEGDGMYYIEIPGITPDVLDQQLLLEVTDSRENSLTVAYSPLNYIVRMNEKGSESLKNLLKALYQYHLAAKQLAE